MCRLGAMLCLTLMFFLVELICGHIINSLALISDSYHMLSDVVAMVIAMISIRVYIYCIPEDLYYIHNVVYSEIYLICTMHV